MKFKSIRKKIFVAMFVAAALPLLIACGLILYQVSQKVEQDRALASNRIHQDLKERIDEYSQSLNETAYQIYSNSNLIQSIALDKEFLTDSRTYDTVRDIREFFLSVYNQSRITDILGMYLLRSDGEQLGAFFPKIHPHHSQSYLKGLLDQLQKSGNQPYTAFDYSNTYGEPVLQFLYPVRYRGNPTGMLVIDIREQTFRDLVERYNHFYHGRIVITDHENRIVYATDPHSVGTRYQAAAYGKPMEALSTPLDTTSDWTLRYLYENDPDLRFYKTAAYGMVAFVVLLAILCSFSLSYSLTKPIIQLHRKMGRIQIGDYDARVDVVTPDEIGYLGNQFNKMAETIQQLIEHDLKLRMTNQESQIKALQAQISPHFLFNTLQMMSGMAEMNGVPDLQQICKSLSHMYRYNMKIENEWVSIRDELLHIRNYLVILNKRYAGMLSLRTVLEPGIRDLFIPKLILQPIIENAVEHGLIPSKRRKKLMRISGRLAKEEGIVYLYVTDNGVGLTEEARSRAELLLSREAGPGDNGSNSIGLANVQVRIGLICGDAFGMHIRSAVGRGTCVVYKLPMKAGTPL